jgi:hypothetical protein
MPMQVVSKSKGKVTLQPYAPCWASRPYTSLWCVGGELVVVNCHGRLLRYVEGYDLGDVSLRRNPDRTFEYG